MAPMKLTLPLLLVSLFACDAVAQTKPAPQKVRRVKRVKRPVFNQADGAASDETIFFRDVYAEAIVGERPDVAALAESTKSKSNEATAPESTANDNSWSQLVDATSIEDEVKAQQQKVSQLVTTPVVFQTKFDEVNQSFEILSVLFSVIRQYDGDVRWSEHEDFVIARHAKRICKSLCEEVRLSRQILLQKRLTGAKRPIERD